MCACGRPRRILTPALPPFGQLQWPCVRRRWWGHLTDERKTYDKAFSVCVCASSPKVTRARQRDTHAKRCPPRPHKKKTSTIDTSPPLHLPPSRSAVDLEKWDINTRRKRTHISLVRHIISDDDATREKRHQTHTQHKHVCDCVCGFDNDDDSARPRPCQIVSLEGRSKKDRRVTNRLEN